MCEIQFVQRARDAPACSARTRTLVLHLPLSRHGKAGGLNGVQDLASVLQHIRLDERKRPACMCTSAHEHEHAVYFSPCCRRRCSACSPLAALLHGAPRGVVAECDEAQLARTHGHGRAEVQLLLLQAGALDAPQERALVLDVKLGVGGACIMQSAAAQLAVCGRLLVTRRRAAVDAFAGTAATHQLHLAWISRPEQQLVAPEHAVGGIKPLRGERQQLLLRLLRHAGCSCCGRSEAAGSCVGGTGRAWGSFCSPRAR